MNKVITINLNGNAYQLEEGGYESLRSYLANAARTLEGNPDKAEIITDIEQAIADKCRAVLGSYKTVVGTREIEQIIAEMGPVDGGSAPPEPDPASGPTGARPAEDGAEGPPRRLYKIREGAMIGGVCNGIAAYFGLDPTWVRLLFVALAFVTVGVAIYIVLLLVVPTAETEAEKATACGGPFTAQEFIRRAKAGYYEGMKHFHDKQAHREWKWKFKREMREWKRNFRREVRGHARSFRAGWHPYWGSPPRYGFGSGLILAFCTLCRSILGLVFFFAFLCFVCTGGIFGFFLPHTVPFWLGIVLLIVAYQILALPFKVLKHAARGYGGWGPHFVSPLAVLMEAAASLAFLLFMLWLAAQFFPGLHHVLYQLPQALRDLADSIRQWWDSGR